LIPTEARTDFVLVTYFSSTGKNLVCDTVAITGIPPEFKSLFYSVDKIRRNTLGMLTKDNKSE